MRWSRQRRAWRRRGLPERLRQGIEPCDVWWLPHGCRLELRVVEQTKSSGRERWRSRWRSHWCSYSSASSQSFCSLFCSIFRQYWTTQPHRRFLFFFFRRLLLLPPDRPAFGGLWLEFVTLLVPLVGLLAALLWRLRWSKIALLGALMAHPVVPPWLSVPLGAEVMVSLLAAARPGSASLPVSTRPVPTRQRHCMPSAARASAADS